ncbi:adenosylcobinamide-phosphate synthase CbiB [Pseudophaeobacter sp. EL27]|uniref:adenosylcobinamide-phosphate synthase CbiB n=1 Tax=Pseudophaeobacter sp. EL27 TaxID=2107580 RepID=UPI000EFB420D|nr:adenosylcobinamide-phosphate synthase CbiB [Pseudophaeobacter sp. EL27]
MSTAEILLLALVLDAALGEPDWLWSRLPHPAVLMGKAVSWLEVHLNTGDARRAKGVLAVTLLVCLGLFTGWLLSLFGPLVELLVAAILIAQRSLVEHLRAVADGLSQSLARGRQAVAMIVSRDTDNMTGPQVARSAIESGSENMSDGVVAPAFWFLIAGLPGLLAYKMINTGDSMIGYRTPRYEAFGWATARLDDLVNLIPARLTGVMIALVGGVLGDWPAIAKDAARHRSPNAGWPEAAMARALGLSLAGPRSYDGEMRDFAWVNAPGAKSITGPAILRCCDILWRAWGLGLALLVAFALIF